MRELLPDLGSGFVEACLEYFDHDPERVVNSLLEENLPPHLAELDRKTAAKKKTEEVGRIRHLGSGRSNQSHLMPGLGIDNDLLP